MKDIFNNVLNKLINEKKGFKLIAWIFIIVIILAIVFYPILMLIFCIITEPIKELK